MSSMIQTLRSRKTFYQEGDPHMFHIFKGVEYHQRYQKRDMAKRPKTQTGHDRWPEEAQAYSAMFSKWKVGCPGMAFSACRPSLLSPVPRTSPVLPPSSTATISISLQPVVFFKPPIISFRTANSSNGSLRSKTVSGGSLPWIKRLFKFCTNGIAFFISPILPTLALSSLSSMERFTASKSSRTRSMYFSCQAGYFFAA